MSIGGVFRVGIGRGIPAVGAILFNMQVARQLSLAEADRFFFWFAAVYVLSFFSKLGVDTYVLRELSAGRECAVSACKRAVFLVSVILAGAAGALYGECLGLLASLPFLSCVAINSSILRAKGRDLLGGFFEVSLISACAFFVLLLLVLAGSKDVMNVASVFLVVSILVFLVSECLAGWPACILGGKGILPPELLESVRFVVSPLMVYLSQWVAVFFLGFFGEGGVSTYSIAVRLASVFAFLAITVDGFVAPRFSRLISQGDFQAIHDLLLSMRKKTFGLVLLLGFGYAICGYFSVQYFLGEQYWISFQASLILAFSYCFMLVLGPYQYLLLMGGGEKEVNVCNAISLVVVFAGCLAGVALDISNILFYSVIVMGARVIGTVMMRHFAARRMKRGWSC